jgi:predicted lipoprotein with Yx(FWY)xxD motif
MTNNDHKGVIVMKGLLLTAGALAALLLLSVGLTGALASRGPAATATKVAVAKTGLGRILVDGRGHTLYLFEKDKRGKSACSGACAAAWPPLLASGKPIATAGAKASLLGTTRRADGRLQVTYAHHPLYTFVEDVRRGQTTGEGLEGFGAEWYAVSPGGAGIEKGGSSSTGTSSNPGSGGYGY